MKARLAPWPTKKTTIEKQVALAQKELEGVGSLVKKGLAVVSREFAVERVVALRKVLCGSSTKYRENCKTGAEGMIEGELGAENVAPEAAVATDIIALVEGGTLLEQRGHLRDRQQCRDDGRDRPHAEHEGETDAEASRKYYFS